MAKEGVTAEANGVPNLPRHTFSVVVALAYIAGFADGSTFVGADGIFCAHVTGNFVVLAADFARHARADEWLKLATFPIFVAAVLASTWFHRRRRSEPLRDSTRELLAFESVLFGAAAVTGFATTASTPGAPRVIIVALLVTAMGIQNAIHRLRPELAPMTTVMTGNVTTWLVERREPASAAKRRLLAAVVVAFALGCLCGGFGVARFGFAALAVPTVVAVFVRSRLRNE
jgi:uncharacterized membrane protein YoaK (UPF0700 family)